MFGFWRTLYKLGFWISFTFGFGLHFSCLVSGVCSTCLVSGVQALHFGFELHFSCVISGVQCTCLVLGVPCAIVNVRFLEYTVHVWFQEYTVHVWF